MLKFERFVRGNRGNIGRDVFPDRERDRERPREREPVRNRLDRDHHERYSDSRNKGISSFLIRNIRVDSITVISSASYLISEQFHIVALVRMRAEIKFLHAIG